MATQTFTIIIQIALSRLIWRIYVLHMFIFTYILRLVQTFRAEPYIKNGVK